MNEKIEKAVQWAVAIANDSSHGYSQSSRLGNPDYDCSSFVATALHNAGFNIAVDSYTGNLFSRLKAIGYIMTSVNGERKRGDIFLTPGKHVVMCVNSSTIVHASIGENGKIRNTKPGDQTGKEICTRSFYTPSYGWKYHLTYPESIDVRNLSKLSALQCAKNCIAGKYGNMPERKAKVESLGFKYDDIRKLVNGLLKERGTEQLLIDIIQGDYGNGEERKKKLQAKGYDYREIGEMVNAIMKYYGK